MSDPLPIDVAGELPLHGPVKEGPAQGDGVPQDPDWSARCRRRYKAALEVLSEATGSLTGAELQAAVTERVPLAPYDVSTSSSGAVRAWTNFNITLTTVYEHGGWLHATPSGWRITRQGAAGMVPVPSAQELFDTAVAEYKLWDEARKENLAGPAADAGTDIVHAGAGRRTHYERAHWSRTHGVRRIPPWRPAQLPGHRRPRRHYGNTCRRLRNRLRVISPAWTTTRRASSLPMR